MPDSLKSIPVEPSGMKEVAPALALRAHPAYLQPARVRGAYWDKFSISGGTGAGPFMARDWPPQLVSPAIGFRGARD